MEIENMDLYRTLFNDYEEAYKDMEKRSKYLLEQNLCRKGTF